MSKKKKAQKALNGEKKINFLLVAILLFITFLTFNGSKNSGFVNWDDDVYLLNNPDITESGLQHPEIFFTRYYNGHYHPLTMLVYAAEYNIFGINAQGYHIINLLIHLGVVLLVFVFLKKLSGSFRVAIIAAALFALNPMRAETVCWISDLKDLLFTFFYLASLVSYLNFLDNKHKKSIIFCGIWFVLAFMSKLSAVTLPLVLLIIDYYKSGRINKKMIINKIPLLLVSLALGILAIVALDAQDAIYRFKEDYSLVDRFLITTYAYSFYFFKTIFPVNLSSSYFFPSKTDGLLPWLYYLSPLFPILLATWIYRAKKFRREWITGLAFFTITIVFFLQLVPSGRVFAADRYVYLPHVGLMFIMAWAINQLMLIQKLRVPVISLLGISLAVWIYLSVEQQKIWTSGESLFSDLIEKNPGQALGYVNRGLARYYGFTKDHSVNMTGAHSDFLKATQIDSNDTKAWFNLGNTSFSLGYTRESLPYFDKALNLDSLNASIWNNRGLAKSLLLMDSAAINDYNQALRLDPEYSDAWFNRGATFYNTGVIEKACTDWKKAQSLGNIRAKEMLKKYCN